MISQVDREDLVSLTRWAYKYFHANIPGFEAFLEGSNDNQFVRNVILKFLTTKNLAKVTEPLRDEVGLATSELFTESKGEPICRNEEWLDLAVQYATTGWLAANELRDWPRPLRPLVHWFLPLCTKARAQVKQARAIIGPYAEERRRLRAQGHKFNDALEWFEEASIGDMGLTQKGLYQMKFMDSFIKECQRMKPIHSENQAQLISTSPDHLGFSHGLHACPGRFFAAKEVKMALVHLLFKYEWKTPADWSENNPENSFNIATDPWLRIQIRRREQNVV
ncbi:hypothetical protein KVR01_013417 [Diaporthe batatas]|uniref:uncharacterized protein n=1 Tax=Diaporthe batatas TaxID=748121 RepID=UPI001D05B8EE|nr:uncharacterized protein KVR01_013417 [Diaporthe batatas]KAG8156812.1 hypothetical protein KVR01_013417 [Diaporthe batatas]